MCNGFLTIDYEENIPDAGTSSDKTDDTTYGLWAHTGSFTFESIITPYDIMGAGTTNSTQSAVANRLTSKKIFPAKLNAESSSDTQGDTYMTGTLRDSHEMAIFSSTNFSLFLVNESPTSGKGNTRHLPARYKIRAKIKIGTNTTREFTSPVVISPNQTSFYKYSATEDLTGISNNRMQFIKVGDVDATAAYGVAPATISVLGVNHPSASFTMTEITIGKTEFFIRNGSTYINLGIPVSGNSQQLNFISISSANQTLINAGCELFVRDRADPAYINNAFHIACFFDNTSREVGIYFNGSKVLSEIHQDLGDFIFAREDLFIGANGAANTGANSATNNKQFMGELHELSIVNKRKEVFSSITNLTPTYDDALVYLRFEEIDE